MPLAMSVVWEAIKYPEKSKKIAELLKKFDTVLGIKIDYKKEEENIPEEIQKLIEERKQARELKDWAKSDEIRDIINEKGYEIKDTKNGTEIIKK